jgi:hypothetical protein
VSKIGKSEYASRFVGFVDREFREFDLESEIQDLVGKHNIIDRLVWSRGHSIENYFFDFAVLARPLRHHSVTLYYRDALDLFQQNIEQILREVCAIGLAGWKCKSLKHVRSSVADWNIVERSASGFSINTEKWMDFFIKERNMRYEDALNLKEAYQEWSMKVSGIDFNIVRWLCDGHTGLAFIWAAFARCVFEASKKSDQGDPRKEASKVLRADKTVRFNVCASEWASQVVKQSCEYPEDIFAILGISKE